MLATLTTGDRIPGLVRKPDQIFGYALAPGWLTVIRVLGPGSYEVEHPDGHRETLTDSK